MMKNYILGKIREKPELGLILGSGLGGVADLIAGGTVVKYSDIPGFPCGNVESHAGEIHFGSLLGKNVMCMKGRVHCYEGFTMAEAAKPVKLMSELGVKTLIVTNAAGGINVAPGELMVISDHIKLCAENPLTGNDIPPRFFPMNEVYDKKLAEIAFGVSKSLGIPLKKGIYAYMSGPCYETPAEIHALSVMGADAVGMSTVPEVIMAAHSGISVLGISCITNFAAGISEKTISHEEVMEMGAKVTKSFQNLIMGIIDKL